ncbi:LysR family transcriptional regulator [Phenylobacterium aquaticum]|uniref:LysR family transcriptional regulator n=1 Tax=Phenylobacterium aquaticum TaxID=1763816 RepID=UPI001F5C9CBB|nr:LysR family transcriptional regulator [Phenylobacterium aquaticum]MCI3133874.1 LysR family transcriptional regulator [Phenylobacterium aquaticum]
MFENLTPGPLPSLNALRAFEAMARTGRATLAAEELHVTHSAVSRQVKALEETLGVRLFSGPKHRLELTEAGRELLPALTAAFDQIAGAVGRIRGGAEDLHIAVNASISVKWLIPRLARFAEAHPEVRLHLAELASHATSHRGADAVVRIVPTARLADPLATPFIQSHLGLVMSPALAERFAADPLQAPRLAATTHPQGWAIWAALAGVELPPKPEQPFAHLHFALDAAIAGLGAAIMSWPLVADYIASGRLVAPYGFRKAESAFALLAAPGVGKRSLDRFRAWLVAEGAKTAPAPQDPPH